MVKQYNMSSADKDWIVITIQQTFSFLIIFHVQLHSHRSLYVINDIDLTNLLLARRETSFLTNTAIHIKIQDIDFFYNIANMLLFSYERFWFLQQIRQNVKINKNWWIQPDLKSRDLNYLILTSKSAHISGFNMYRVKNRVQLYQIDMTPMNLQTGINHTLYM